MALSGFFHDKNPTDVLYATGSKDSCELTSDF
jgi:hypothetical protein